MFPPENKHCKDPTGKLNRYLCIEKRIGSSTLWDERPSTGVKYSKGNAAQLVVDFLSVSYTKKQHANFTLLKAFLDRKVQETSKGERRKQAIQPILKHQPMKYRTLNQDQTTPPGTSCPTLYEKCVGSLTSPASHVTLKVQLQETAPTVYSPCPRRLKRLTICRCHYKGRTFSSTKLDLQNFKVYNFFMAKKTT